MSEKPDIIRRIEHHHFESIVYECETTFNCTTLADLERRLDSIDRSVKDARKELEDWNREAIK